MANKTGSVCRSSAQSLIDAAKGFDLNFQNESISVLIPKLDPKNPVDLVVQEFDYKLGKKLNVAPLQGAADTVCTIAEAGTWVVSYLTLSNIGLSIWACHTARSKAREQVADFDDGLMEPSASSDYGLAGINIKRGAAAAGGSFTQMDPDTPSASRNYSSVGGRRL
jgi:hypothetical protein